MNPGWSIQEMPLNPRVQLSVMQGLALPQHSRVILAQVTEKTEQLLERKCEKARAKKRRVKSERDGSS